MVRFNCVRLAWYEWGRWFYQIRPARHLLSNIQLIKSYSNHYMSSMLRYNHLRVPCPNKTSSGFNFRSAIISSDILTKISPIIFRFSSGFAVLHSILVTRVLALPAENAFFTMYIKKFNKTVVIIANFYISVDGLPLSVCVKKCSNRR